MTDTTKIALDRNEIQRRRATRSRYRFKLYGYAEMAWFARNPDDWDEECRLDGHVDMGPHLDDPDDPRVDAAIAEWETKRRKRGGVAVKFAEWKCRCPYGIWTCADGREVLFNRQYWAILERYPGKPAKPAKPGEWVEWTEQDWYFNDGNPPWRRDRIGSQTLARVNKILAEWGLPPLPKPPPRGPWKLPKLHRHGEPISQRRNPWEA